MWPFSNRRAKIELALRDARERLWSGDAVGALDRLGEFESARGPRAIQDAYASLSHRMRGDFHRALDCAQSALAADPRCLEARFACAVAELRKDAGELTSVAHARGSQAPDLLARCILHWFDTRKCVASDAEGHFLNLLGHALFGECAANMEERADSRVLRFVHTPAVKISFHLLDGEPSRALNVAPPSGASAIAANMYELARGLAGYRVDDPPAFQPLAARDILGDAQGDPLAPSIHALVSARLYQNMVRRVQERRGN